MPFDEKGNWYPPGGWNKQTQPPERLLPPGPPTIQNAQKGYGTAYDLFKTIPVQQPQQDNSFLGKLDSLITQNPVSRTIDSFVSKGANALSFGLADKLKNYTNDQLASKGIAPIYQSGNSTAEKIAGGIGTFAGSLLPIGGAYKLTGGLAGKLAPNAPKLADRLIRGGLAGTAYGTANELIDAGFDTRNDGSQTLGERAKNVGLDAALFGVGDAALYGVGKGLKYASDKSGFSNWVKNLFDRGSQNDALSNEILALPPGRPEPLQLPAPRPIAGLLPEPRKPDFIAGYFQKSVPRAFKPERPLDTLNRVLEEIRPEVLKVTQEAKVPALESKKSMIDYIAESLPDVSRSEISKLSLRDLQDLAIQVARERNVPTIMEAARQIAAKRGYNLDRLFAEADQNVSFLDRAKYVAKQNRGAMKFGYIEPPKISRGPTKPVPYVEAQPKTITPPPLPNAKMTNQSIKIEPPPIGQKPKREPSIGISSKKNNDRLIKVNESTGTNQNIETRSLLDGIDATRLTDHVGFKYNSTDVYRNFRDVFKDQFPQIKKAVLDPFDAAKKEFVKMQEDYLKRLKNDIVDGLGIKKGSKLSALVQKYGEKKITLEELKRQAPNDWKKVVKADQWFRKNYDELIDKVNDVRAKIYPNNPEKLVPKRKDYYRHFQEFTGLTGLKNLFDTPSAIDPSLVGISEFTKPNSKFASFMQKRGLGPYKNDAVGGFLNYIQPASYAVNIDPQIKVFNNLAKELANATLETKNVNQFIDYLHKFSQDLAGKTNAADRYLQENIPGGRKTLALMRWFNNRVKANVILGNLGSTLAQIANIPNGVAFAKQYSIPGAGKALLALVKPNEAMQQSGFLKERFIGKVYREFDTRMIEQPRRLAEWMMETADRVGTYFVWNSAYTKGIAEGVSNPVKYADEQTRRLIAGRGVGEVPLMQKSTLFQSVAPFQLEVANQWRVMKEFVKEKDFAGIATLLFGSYLLNKGMEKIKGSGVIFDPIQAILDASAEDLTVGQRVGRLAGEVLSNIPLGQSIASLYPEYGGKFMGLENIFGELPTRKNLFGDNDPTRFGGGPLIAGAIQDPLYKALFPFGGNQIKKTLQGLTAINKEGDYVKNYATDFFKFGQLDNNQLRYPIDLNNPAKQLQVLAFGPSATQEAQMYYKNERRPLSEQQTKKYESVSDKQGYYDYLMKARKIETLKRQINEIKKDPKLSFDDKKEKIQKVVEKLRQEANK